MITLSVIDIIVFIKKLVCFACGAAWGITEAALLAMGIPALLLAAVMAGAAALTIPHGLLALLAAVLWPVLEGI